jgi:hypothetical protein
MICLNRLRKELKKVGFSLCRIEDQSFEMRKKGGNTYSAYSYDDFQHFNVTCVQVISCEATRLEEPMLKGLVAGFITRA